MNFWEIISHPFVAGALAVTLSQFAAQFIKATPARIWRWTLNRVSAYIVVCNDDNIYNWYRVWLDELDYTKKSRRLSVTMRTDDNDEDSLPKALFTPAPGNHFFWRSGRFIWINIARDDLQGTGGSSYWRKEEMTIRAFGFGGNSTIKAITAEARAFALGNHDKRIKIWVAMNGVWKLTKRVRARAFDSVVLPGATAKQVYDDCVDFLGSEKLYRAIGTPYRFGLLFEGVPGSGKTSMVSALAGALCLDIFIVNIAAEGMTDEKLNELMLSIPGNGIVLFEDVDAAFKERAEGDNKPRITFSGLLNAIDGVAAKEGRILIQTTNHKEKLDPALIRTGRADVHVHFGYATLEQIVTSYTRVFPDATWGESTAFSQQFAGRDVCMADVQFVLLGLARKSKQPAEVQYAKAA